MLSRVALLAAVLPYHIPPCILLLFQFVIEPVAEHVQLPLILTPLTNVCNHDGKKGLSCYSWVLPELCVANFAAL